MLKLRHLLLLLPLGMMPSLHSSVVLAQPKPPSAEQAQEARALFKRGFAAFNEKRYPEAYEALSKAWQLQASYDIAGNLGFVELELHKFRDAAEHLEYAVANLPPSAKQKERDFLSEGLAAARKEVGGLSVKVDPAGASIEVDGKPAPSPLPAVLYVEPGTRTLTSRLTGYAEASRTITIAKGTTETIVLAMDPLPAAQPNERTSPPFVPAGSASTPDGPAPARRSIAPPIVLGAAGAIGLGVGIGLLVASGSKLDEAERESGAILTDDGSCKPAQTGFETRCEALASLSSDGKTLHDWGIVSLIGGAAAGAVALGWAGYLAFSSDGKTDGVQVSATPTANGGRLVIRGAF